MSDTQQPKEQPKQVKLWSRCEAAMLNVETGEVVLNSDVNPKWLVQDLVRDIQTLQQKIQELEKKLEELQPKQEETKDI